MKSFGHFSGRSVLVHLLKRFSWSLLQGDKRKCPKKVQATESRLMGRLRNHADSSPAVDKGILTLQPLK